MLVRRHRRPVYTAALAWAAWAACLGPAAAQDNTILDQPVVHGPLPAETERVVRAFVGDVAQSLGAFYPKAEFRRVHAVYFPSGAIIVCGEMNKADDGGARSGWRYFTSSGPLFFESDRLETLCDERPYKVRGFGDGYEYSAEFNQAAR